MLPHPAKRYTASGCFKAASNWYRGLNVDHQSCDRAGRQSRLLSVYGCLPSQACATRYLIFGIHGICFCARAPIASWRKAPRRSRGSCSDCSPSAGHAIIRQAYPRVTGNNRMAASFARSENTQNSLRKIPYMPLFSARVGNAHVHGPSFPVGRSNNFHCPLPSAVRKSLAALTRGVPPAERFASAHDQCAVRLGWWLARGPRRNPVLQKKADIDLAVHDE
jgi:hypothetical protein